MSLRIGGRDEGIVSRDDLHLIILYFAYCCNICILKIVTNEKLGGSGSCLVFEDGFVPWRWMSVYFLI